MASRNGFIEELALTTEGMFSNGKHDPRAAEIADRHFAGLALPEEMVDVVAKALPRVKKILEQDFERPVYLLNKTYYRRFRHNAPETEADGRRCLAGVGHGARTEGIGLHVNGDADLIWRASVQKGFSDGTPKVMNAAERVKSAIDNHRITEGAGEDILQAARRQIPAQLQRPTLTAGEDNGTEAA